MNVKVLSSSRRRRGLGLAQLVSLVCASLTSYVAAAEPISGYTPEQQATLAYYKKHYPAYYARYYGAALEPKLVPPPAPPASPPAGTAGTAPAGTIGSRDAPGTAPEEREEGSTGLVVPGMIDGETEMNGARTLEGHTFQFPRLIDNAFTATNFQIGTSVEVYHQGDVTTSVPAVDGSVQEVTYDRDLAFIRLNYGVDFAPHEVVTIGLDADYLIEVGANQQAILLYGGQTGYDFRPNVKVRVYRSDAYGVQLAIRAFGTFSGGIRAVPQGLLTQLSTRLDDAGAGDGCLATDVGCAIADDTVTQGLAITRERKGGGGTVNLAKSLGRYLGSQFSVGLEAARASVTADQTGTVEATGLLFTAGASPSLNFYPGWPVALTLEYRFELHRNSYDANERAQIPETVVVTAKGHRFGAGLYYTGRRDLLLGWSAGASLLEDADRGPGEVGEAQPDALLFAAQFDMRYFF